jgi:hypothetical protein
MSPSFYLSDAEVADLCAPLTQPAAQVRYLQQMGLTVAKKPNGRPVVVRSHAETVLSGRQQAPAGAEPHIPLPGPGPDVIGFRERRALRRSGERGTRRA